MHHLTFPLHSSLNAKAQRFYARFAKIYNEISPCALCVTFANLAFKVICTVSYDSFSIKFLVFYRFKIFQTAWRPLCFFRVMFLPVFWLNFVMMSASWTL